MKRDITFIPSILMIMFLFIPQFGYSKDNQNRRIVETLKCSQDKYKLYKSKITILDFKDLPYNKGRKAIKKAKHYDDNLVPLHDYKGKLNYHPVLLAERALKLLDVFNTTQDIIYLESAKRIANKLLSISLQIKSAYFFPYMFNFPLHGYKEETMLSPWYSGMAQGEILSLFVRLYEINHDNFYLETCSKIFNSFDTSNCVEKYTPWITCVDENGYLWIEEYPHTPPAYTLNGMIFAIFGIYDYYRITKDMAVENVLRGAILTIKENIHKFRVKNGISQYCLRHPEERYLKYHKLHIRQLKMLYKMTGDNYFLEISEKFVLDTKYIDIK